MFENTKKALEVFQKAVECAQCKTPKKDLQYLGTSCKHAQCWDCIKEISTRQPGRRSTSRNHCSTCAFPLDITKIAGAHVLNTCFDTLTELKELLEKAQSMPPLSQVDLACTQRILGDFDDEKCDEIDKKRAVERFLETQGHMPDCDVGEENFAVKTEQSENRDISPELDLFNDYGGRMAASAAQENSSAKRASSKRPSTSSIGDQEFERKPKRTSILKPAPPAEQFELFASQIPKRTHKNEMLTPFVNRRSTAPVTGKVGEYADPLKSASYSGKSEMFPSTDDDDPFTKKIVLTKRQASLEQHAKVVKKEPTPESEDYTPRTRRSAVKFAPSRSQSPMSFGERSMAVKTEQVG
uniref:Uncharacterized protein n=1 Tax=Caenorhabditis japonica TaxID=281687 RepID=A0A8R1E0V2_CAEJA